MPEIVGYTIVTDDMRLSLDFYRLVGVDAPVSADGRGFVVSALGPDAHLAFKRGSVAEGTTGRPRVDVRCTNSAEVDRIYRSMLDSGQAVVGGPRSTAWGAYSFTALDPGGNPVEVFAPLP